MLAPTLQAEKKNVEGALSSEIAVNYYQTVGITSKKTIIFRMPDPYFLPTLCPFHNYTMTNDAGP
jgi:hypothetical protein